MGKTESGAIWLSRERTSPYQFFQYWRNVDDADVDMCLKFLTELPKEEIASLAHIPVKRCGKTRIADSFSRRR